MYRTVFWTLWERERVGLFGRMALKHVYYQVRNESPVYVWYRIQDAWGWCMGMTHSFKKIFLKYKFIYFNWRLITLQYCIGLPYINMNRPRVYTCSPSWTPLPPPSPYHPTGSSQCTSPEHPVSCIEPGLVTRFTCDNLHVSMPFSQIIPPLPSPTESKRLFYASVSLLLSRIQGYCYHLSKFHIYVLVYCIGVFLSGLLHSV